VRRQLRFSALIPALTGAALAGLAAFVPMPAFAAGEAPTGASPTAGRPFGAECVRTLIRGQIAPMLDDCRKAADAGDAQAAYAMALLHEAGQLVKQDRDTAARYYRIGADDGLAPAQYGLAVFNEQGRAGGKGDQPLIQELVGLYRAAAAQNYAPAQNNLARLYAKGGGVEKSIPHALELYRKSAEQGYALAQYNLGMLLMSDGPGDRADRMKEAVSWWRKGALQGYGPAQTWLGVSYLEGAGAARDPAEAERWLRKAAEQGLPDAQFLLAGLYREGKGAVVRDPNTAAEMYRRAAEQGHPGALHNLGLLHIKGIGVPEDRRKGVDMLEQAARSGFAASAVALGKLLLETEGAMPEERAEGLAWVLVAERMDQVSAREEARKSREAANSSLTPEIRRQALEKFKEIVGTIKQ
jgi:TPR repeat protein